MFKTIHRMIIRPLKTIIMQTFTTRPDNQLPNTLLVYKDQFLLAKYDTKEQTINFIVSDMWTTLDDMALLLQDLRQIPVSSF